MAVMDVLSEHHSKFETRAWVQQLKRWPGDSQRKTERFICEKNL